MSAPRLICLDTVLVDVVLSVSQLPRRSGDELANGQLITTGGGFNAMSAAARHDMDVIYAGRLGRGPFSDLASSSLNEERIATPFERNDDLDTGVCIVLVEPDGERSFVTAPGAESTLRSADLEGLDPRGGDFVLVSGYNVMYPRADDVVVDWLDRLPPDVHVFFDPATRTTDIPPENLRAVMHRATWLSCNATEAKELTNDDNVYESASKLAASNELNVIVRNGAEGCVVVVNRERARDIAGFHTNVVDTNGAGDVHNGVFVAELASGHDALAAARWANAAAAMAISRLGPATCPMRSEVEQFLSLISGQR